MSNANSPYSGGDTPDLFTGLNAGQVDGCDVSSSASLGTSDTLIPTQGAAKAYVDSRIANHSTNHTDLFYTQNQVDSMLGGYSIEDYGDITDTPTGIIEASDITVSWNNTTKGVTITPAGAGTYVWARGVKHMIDVAGETIVGDGTHYTLAQGLWYYYYEQNLAGDDLELNASQVFPGMAVAIVAMGYYDADTHTVSAHDYLSSATSTVKVHEVVKCVTGSLPAGTSNGQYYRRLTSNLGSTALSTITVTDGNWENVSAVIADVAYPNMIGGDLFVEGHTTKISPYEHHQQHFYEGCLWKDGFLLYRNAKDTGNPTGDKESRIAVQGGTVADEDLEFTVANDDTPDAVFDQDLGGATDAASETNPALLPVMYLDGTKWKMTKPQPWAFHHGGTRPYYNSISSGSGLTQMSSGYFVPYYVCATNHSKYPVVLVMGQGEYSTRDAAKVDPRTLSWGAVNFSKEIKVLWRIIIEGKTSFTNAAHYAVIREVADFRANNGSVLTFSASNDHSALTNLGYDASRHYGFKRATTLSTSEPGVNNDIDDTAALGNGFVKGDFWVETDDKQLFVCMDNASGAADWDEVLTAATTTWTTQTGKISTAEGAIDVLEKKHGITNSAVATDTYTVTDTDNTNDIFCDPAARAFTVNLPTLADNLGRIIRVKVTTAGGAVTLDGEGAETIDGVTTFVMQSVDDHCTVIGEATGWRILTARQKMDTGWMKRDSWTNEHLGSVNLTYDNKGGAAFIVGEVVTEYTDAGRTTPSGQSGIILSDSGTVLVLKNVAGTGNFTNDYYLKGNTSTGTAQVNGATIGVDTYFTHNFNKTLPLLTKVNHYVSSDKTEATIIRQSSYVYSNEGINHYGYDANNLLIQTGSAALAYLSSSGTGTATGANWYYKLVAEVII